MDPSSCPRVDMYKEHALKYFQDLIPVITSADLEEFMKYTVPYVSKKPDLNSDLYDAIETVKVNKAAQKNFKRMSHKELKTEVPIFINMVKQVLKKDVLDHYSLYKEQDELTEESVGDQPVTSKPGITSHSGNLKATSSLGSKSNKRHLTQSVYSGKSISPFMKNLIQLHSESGERGTVVNTWNKEVDFSRSRKVNNLPQTAKLIGNFQPNKFLNIKAEDFRESFNFRLALMESEFARLLKQDYTRPNVLTQSFNDATWIIARITLDEEFELSLDRIKVEFLTNTSEVRSAFVKASSLQQYIFYPNMITALQVLGDIYDPSCPMQVLCQRELDEDKDLYNPIKSSVNSSPDSVMQVLVFKGPYTVRGDAYFGGFDMVLHHITELNPSYVILMGPFVSADQVNQQPPTPMDGSDGYDLVRRENFERLIKAIPKSMELELIIAQDFNEADNYFPVPVPFTMGNVLSVNGVKVVQVGTPAILNLGSKINLALSGDDTITNLFAFPAKNKAGVLKYERIMKSIVSQKCLNPAFPTKSPLDITQIKSLNFGISTATALEFKWKDKDATDLESSSKHKSSTSAIVVEDLKPIIESASSKGGITTSKRDQPQHTSSSSTGSFTFAPNPDVWIIPSVLPTFVTEARGVLACNPKSVLLDRQEGVEFGTFARICVDPNIAGSYSKTIKIEVLRT